MGGMGLGLGLVSTVGRIREERRKQNHEHGPSVFPKGDKGGMG